MSIAHRVRYYRRILAAYLMGKKSQLTFWHEIPTINPHWSLGILGPYYMAFSEKAHYRGDYDSFGIPLLNYHGSIGRQYNPIAIAQYGLGNYNVWKEIAAPEYRERFIQAADWLVAHLERNSAGLEVWHHHFDWEYRTPLCAPWYSGLAQGQGLSVLVRAAAETGQEQYLTSARRAFEAFLVPVESGGVVHVDEKGYTWIEEYIVNPPTHILNGFIWALWGIQDYYLATKEDDAAELFARCIATLRSQLHRYDIGFWSLYEQSGTRLSMLASPFYHHLHIVQLTIMAAIAREPLFLDYANRWKHYGSQTLNRYRAYSQKVLFKLLYY